MTIPDYQTLTAPASAGPHTQGIPGVTDQFAEYAAVNTTEPLRQGDVLEAINEHASMWERHLLVLTADCDFANEKNQGRVTCIPILAVDEYLLEMQIPRIRERLANKQTKIILEAISIAGGPKVSGDRLREWASEESADSITAALRLNHEGAARVDAALRSIQRLDAPAHSLEQAIAALVEAQMLGANPPKRENALKTVTVPLRDTFSRPPGDALFLTAVAPALDAGYFAYLRHLEQVWQGEVSTAPTRREARYRRISRMRDRFTHALVQRFALVFMSIGLPSEYEELRDLHSTLFEERFK